MSFLRLRASEEEQSTGRAQFLMSQALDADEAGNADEACELYMQVHEKLDTDNDMTIP